MIISLSLSPVKGFSDEFLRNWLILEKSRCARDGSGLCSTIMEEEVVSA